MEITTRGFMLTVFCDELTSEHLIPNISAFKADCMAYGKMRGHIKNTGDHIDLIKIEIYGSLSQIKEAVNYLKQQYSGKYPITYTFIESRIPG